MLGRLEEADAFTGALAKDTGKAEVRDSDGYRNAFEDYSGFFSRAQLAIVDALRHDDFENALFVLLPNLSKGLSQQVSADLKAGAAVGLARRVEGKHALSEQCVSAIEDDLALAAA